AAELHAQRASSGLLLQAVELRLRHATRRDDALGRLRLVARRNGRRASAVNLITCHVLPTHVRAQSRKLLRGVCDQGRLLRLRVSKRGMSRRLELGGIAVVWVQIVRHVLLHEAKVAGVVTQRVPQRSPLDTRLDATGSQAATAEAGCSPRKLT